MGFANFAIYYLNLSFFFKTSDFRALNIVKQESLNKIK